MSRVLIAIALVVFIASCNNGTEDDMLSKPPYGKLTDSIEQDPANAGLYFRRGTLLYRDGYLDKAESDIHKAWEIEPREQYALTIADLLKQLKKDPLDFLQSAVTKMPNSPFLNIELAYSYLDKNRLDKVMEICNKLIAQHPNNIDALLLKARVLKEQKLDAQAIHVLESAYQYAPGDVELVHTLAFDYAETKDPRAITLSDSLIKMDTEHSHAEPYYFKGVYYSNTGKHAEAIRQFDEAIRTNHNFIDAYINKGIIYYDQKKYEEALSVFALASRVSADEAYPYYWIAKTQQAMGNTADAKQNYTRAYGLDKTMENARDSAARL
jgi:tetratricopeptide (TPR) repeat protein